jgi:tetratricopeptide (TPR) repeat protein
MPEDSYEPDTQPRVIALIRDGDLDQAEAVLDRALEGRPQSPPLVALRAELWRKRGRLAEAEAQLAAARQLDPGDPLVVRTGAELALQQRRLEEAAELFERAFEQRPTAYLASRLVQTLNRLRRHERAAQVARQALESRPEDPWLLSGLAAAEAGGGRREEAVALYEKVLSLRPGDRFAYAQLMRLRTAATPAAEAAAALKGLQRVGGRDRDPRLRILTGDRLRGAGRVSEAAAEYRAAAELEPGNAYAHAQLGFCLRRLGEAEPALEALGRAFLADPANPYTRSSLEALCRERGDFGPYARLVEEAAKLHPEMQALHGLRKRAATLAGGGTPRYAAGRRTKPPSARGSGG